MIGTMAEQLGMPLHAEHGRCTVDLDRLDLAVVVVGDGSNTTAEPIDDLVM